MHAKERGSLPVFPATANNRMGARRRQSGIAQFLRRGHTGRPRKARAPAPEFHFPVRRRQIFREDSMRTRRFSSFKGIALASCLFALSLALAAPRAASARQAAQTPAPQAQSGQQKTGQQKTDRQQSPAPQQTDQTDKPAQKTSVPAANGRASSSSATGQQDGPVVQVNEDDERKPVITHTDLVTFTVTVTATYGRFVTGLGKNAFTVTDDKIPQDITFFSDEI